MSNIVNLQLWSRVVNDLRQMLDGYENENDKSSELEVTFL